MTPTLSAIKRTGTRCVSTEVSCVVAVATYIGCGAALLGCGFFFGFGLRLAGFLARVFKQEVQSLIAANLIRDPAQNAVFLQLFAHGGHRFALLLGDALNLGVHLVVGWRNVLALGDLIHQQRRLYIMHGF